MISEIMLVPFLEKLVLCLRKGRLPSGHFKTLDEFLDFPYGNVLVCDGSFCTHGCLNLFSLTWNGLRRVGEQENFLPLILSQNKPGIDWCDHQDYSSRVCGVFPESDGDRYFEKIPSIQHRVASSFYTHEVLHLIF
jgi:hypothetical protein